MRMKNEAGLRPMKRAFGSRRSNIALRFMARARRFIEAVRLLLHVCKANASLTKRRFYAIINPKGGGIMIVKKEDNYYMKKYCLDNFKTASDYANFIKYMLSKSDYFSLIDFRYKKMSL